MIKLPIDVSSLNTFKVQLLDSDNAVLAETETFNTTIEVIEKDKKYALKNIPNGAIPEASRNNKVAKKIVVTCEELTDNKTLISENINLLITENYANFSVDDIVINVKGE